MLALQEVLWKSRGDSLTTCAIVYYRRGVSIFQDSLPGVCTVRCWGDGRCFNGCYEVFVVVVFCGCYVWVTWAGQVTTTERELARDVVSLSGWAGYTLGYISQ